MRCRICQKHSSEVAPSEGIVVFGDPDNHQNACMICPPCLTWIVQNRNRVRPLWSRIIPFVLVFFLLVGLALVLRYLFWDMMANAIKVDTATPSQGVGGSPMFANRNSPEFYLPEM
jgi:hypothetical protein